MRPWYVYLYLCGRPMPGKCTKNDTTTAKVCWIRYLTISLAGRYARPSKEMIWVKLKKKRKLGDGKNRLTSKSSHHGISLHILHEQTQYVNCFKMCHITPRHSMSQQLDPPPNTWGFFLKLCCLVKLVQAAWRRRRRRRRRGRGVLSYLPCILAFYLAHSLALYLAYLLAFYLVYVLAFYLCAT